MVLRLKEMFVSMLPYPLPWEDANEDICACDCELCSKKSFDLLDLYWASSSSLMYLALCVADTLTQALIPICSSPSHGLFSQRFLLARVYEFV